MKTIRKYKTKKEEIKAKRNNAKMFPIYKMFSWDLLFFYSTQYLFYTTTKGLTPGEVLKVEAFYPLFIIIMQLPAAICADLLGRKRSLVLGNLIMALYIFLLIILPGFMGIFIANIVYAFGYSLKGIQETNILYDSTATKGGEGLYPKINGKGATAYYILDGIASLAVEDNSKMKELLNYHFTEGSLKGISFADLYFAAMNDISKSSAEAVKNSNEIFKICGNVLPVTKDKMKICAELENGYLIEEKSRIAETVYDKLTKINRVYLNPTNCKALPEVIEAIKEADGIIIGPGSLYTNVIPNLLVNGVSRALKETKAIKLYVCNIMTEPGLTDNYSVADHINAIIEHCGEGIIDYCLYDTGEVIPEFIKKYNLDGAELVEQNIEDIKDKKIKLIKENISVIKDDFVRHNSMIIADTLIKMICDDLKYQDKQNEPEYILMNSKLQADKEITKENKRKAKNKKEKNKKSSEKQKSKFASKYSDRIESIKHSDEMAAKRKKARMIKKETKINHIEDKEKIEEMLKQKEEILKAYQESKEKKEIIRPKDYDEIRKEKINKFNNGK